MNYPKKIMNRKELMEMGFPREMLEKIYRTPNQKVAWRVDPRYRNSTIYYDTEELEKWRQEQARLLAKEVPMELRRA